MTPERWRQITAIFHAVRTREPESRSALLDQMCAEDTALRAEVESLLAGDAAASNSGHTAVSIDLMPLLSPGTSFGIYRVEALVGMGGMAQVYRATDSRLGRTVALKILAPGLSQDASFGARLEREARVLASLSHPNVAAIHGVAESDGISALVLEFIDGPTLAAYIARGPLSVPEALTIARQIVLALEAAHAKGAIHRDLKPANIKLTRDGVVKVLDFGIAKAFDAAAGSTSTIQPPSHTATGIVLGTPAYMSPEQARGLAVDERTDIWAFGCVLFEMLSGRGAFAAETASDSLARIIEREPDWSALPPTVPVSLRRLIARCLQKSAADRLHHIADARIEMAEIVKAGEQAAVMYAPRGIVRRVLPLAVVAVLVLATIAGWLTWRNRDVTARSPEAGPSIEFGVTLPNTIIRAMGIDLSPDGRRIAIGATTNASQLWVHTFEPRETLPIVAAPFGTSPFWSPDSSTIAFFAGTKLLRTNADRGAAMEIAEVPPSPDAGSWSKDDVILFASQGKLYRVPGSGGTPVEVSLTGTEGSPVGVRFFPDGQHFFFWGAHGNRGWIQASSLFSPRVVKLVESDCPGAFVPPDILLFVRDTSLMAQRIDFAQWRMTGQSYQIASGVLRNPTGDPATLAISASSNGVVAIAAPQQTDPAPPAIRVLVNWMSKITR